MQNNNTTHKNKLFTAILLAAFVVMSIGIYAFSDKLVAFLGAVAPGVF